MTFGRAFLIRGGAAVAAMAGLMAAPFAGNARTMMVSGCGGVTHMLVIPNDPTAPREDDRNCMKACHAALDRRIKPTDGKKTCC